MGSIFVPASTTLPTLCIACNALPIPECLEATLSKPEAKLLITWAFLFVFTALLIA